MMLRNLIACGRGLSDAAGVPAAAQDSTPKTRSHGARQRHGDDHASSRPRAEPRRAGQGTDPRRASMTARRSTASSTASWRRAATRPAPAPAARTCPTSRPSSPTTNFGRGVDRRGAHRRSRTPPIRSSSSASRTARSSTASTPCGARWSTAWNSSTSSKRGEPPSQTPTRSSRCRSPPTPK